MKKTLMFSMLATMSLYANNINFYLGHLNYKNSIKKYGNFYGFYANSYSVNKNFWIEINAKKLFIKYKNLPNYTSNKFSIVLNSSFKKNNNNFMPYFSYNGIWEKQDNKNFSKIFNIGFINYNSNLNLVINPSFYYSKYNNFNVKQPTLTIGFYYYPKLIDNDVGYFYSKLTYNNIKISKANISPKKNYNNFDLSITNYYKNMQTTITASFGKFAYKNQDKGFITYNLGDEFKYTYGLDYIYYFKNTSYVGMNVNYLKQSNNTEVLATTLYIGRTF